MVPLDFEVWTVKAHEVVIPTIENNNLSRDMSIAIPGRRNILRDSCRFFQFYFIVLIMLSCFQVHTSGCLVRGHGDSSWPCIRFVGRFTLSDRGHGKGDARFIGTPFPE